MGLTDRADEYATRGWTVVSSVVDPATAQKWAYRASGATSQGHRLERPGGVVPGVLDEGGDRSHGILDTYQTERVLPELLGCYETARTIVEQVVRRRVILSPYDRSRVTVKVYQQAGDTHGWHRDTNPITALLILTDTLGDWGTEIEALDGTTFNLRNTAGDLLLMQGRKLRHRVPPLPAGQLRVTVPLNYYHPDDAWRPEGTDELVYGRHA